MSGNETGPRQCITYDFPTMAHARAIKDAYSELCVFREPQNEQQKQLYDGWAAIDYAETDGIIGTVEDMEQTAALLREWGEANTLLDSREPGPAGHGRMRRAGSPHVKAVIARLAVDMADEITLLVSQASVAVDPILDFDQVYEFLDKPEVA